MRSVIKENWLTQKPRQSALNITLMMIALLLFGSLIFIYQFFSANLWMAASHDLVYRHHEYWRLWTALFAHADLSHLLGNLFLFIPFAFFLNGYFGIIFFPLAGFLLGGLVNAIVLLTLPEEATLIGASGVVHWMGAAWVTLYCLLESRDSIKRRVLKSFGASFILFIPSTFHPEVSYLSHLIGYLFGVASALGLHLINRKKYLSKEKVTAGADNNNENENEYEEDYLLKPQQAITELFPKEIYNNETKIHHR